MKRAMHHQSLAIVAVAIPVILVSGCFSSNKVSSEPTGSGTVVYPHAGTTAWMRVTHAPDTWAQATTDRSNLPANHHAHFFTQTAHAQGLTITQKETLVKQACLPCHNSVTGKAPKIEDTCHRCHHQPQTNAAGNHWRGLSPSNFESWKAIGFALQTQTMPNIHHKNNFKGMSRTEASNEVNSKCNVCHENTTALDLNKRNCFSCHHRSTDLTTDQTQAFSKIVLGADQKPKPFSTAKDEYTGFHHAVKFDGLTAGPQKEAMRATCNTCHEPSQEASLRATFVSKCQTCHHDTSEVGVTATVLDERKKFVFPTSFSDNKPVFDAKHHGKLFKLKYADLEGELPFRAIADGLLRLVSISKSSQYCENQGFVRQTAVMNRCRQCHQEVDVSGVEDKTNVASQQKLNYCMACHHDASANHVKHDEINEKIGNDFNMIGVHVAIKRQTPVFSGSATQTCWMCHNTGPGLETLKPSDVIFNPPVKGKYDNSKCVDCHHQTFDMTTAKADTFKKAVFQKQEVTYQYTTMDWNLWDFTQKPVTITWDRKFAKFADAKSAYSDAHHGAKFDGMTIAQKKVAMSECKNCHDQAKETAFEEIPLLRNTSISKCMVCHHNSFEGVTITTHKPVVGEAGKPDTYTYTTYDEAYLAKRKEFTFPVSFDASNKPVFGPKHHGNLFKLKYADLDQIEPFKSITDPVLRFFRQSQSTQYVENHGFVKQTDVKARCLGCHEEYEVKIIDNGTPSTSDPSYKEVTVKTNYCMACHHDRGEDKIKYDAVPSFAAENAGRLPNRKFSFQGVHLAWMGNSSKSPFEAPYPRREPYATTFVKTCLFCHEASKNDDEEGGPDKARPPEELKLWIRKDGAANNGPGRTNCNACHL